MIRILHVVGGLSRGGTESSIMNLYRYIDKNRLQFDYISHHPEMSEYEDEIRSNGGNVYYIPEFTGTNYFRYISSWNNFFQDHKEHAILHSHAWSTAALYLPIARKNQIFTISHSHSVSSGEGLSAWGRTFLKPFIRGNADCYMACSKEAGEWLFGNTIIKGNHFHVLPNAVDVESLRFNSNVRKNLRRKYGVEDQMVIGHIGSFNANKNQTFLVDVFRQIHIKKPKTILWLIGDGEMRDRVEAMAQDLGKSVRFFGVRDDISDLLQAMDLFLFPSKHESFGSAAIEAEAVGIPTICSINVPHNEVLTKGIYYLPLSNETLWVDTVMMLMGNYSRADDTYASLKGSNLDIEVTAKWLQEFYLKIAEKGIAR